MSYKGISISEVLNKINANTSGWFLPQVQRQYVWGARHESEGYVCLLFDSLLKGYPIGGVVLWETETVIPYRKFLEDYAPGIYAKEVDEGRWGKDKFLVYDGQQRLQTLYSALLHKFNGRILHFDLLFDAKKSEADETAFLFRNQDDKPDTRFLRMSELASMNNSTKSKIALEERALINAQGNKDQEFLIRVNLDELWKIFVNEDHKSIAYFPVKADDPNEVNEVFRRLNTGGVALTQLELVLSKIKAEKSDYEEKLWELSKTLKGHSGGIEFSSASILQFFHLQVKRTIRIDESQIKSEDIADFQFALESDSAALEELFKGYLYQLFGINHASIIPRWQAVLPIADYLAARKRGNHVWRIKAIPDSEIRLIHRYFLLSQFCDWNTQTMVNQFAKLTREAGEAGRTFPIEEIRAVAIQKNRTGELSEAQLLSEVWFAVKVMMPKRLYNFYDRKPQIDHIFPLALHKNDETYRNAVDILWNFQPVPDGINNFKSATHPKKFFQSETGRKYLKDYDFLPSSLDSPEWDDYRIFLADREKRMRKKLDEYDLKLQP